MIDQIVVSDAFVVVRVDGKSSQRWRFAREFFNLFEDYGAFFDWAEENVGVTRPKVPPLYDEWTRWKAYGSQGEFPPNYLDPNPPDWW